MIWILIILCTAAQSPRLLLSHHLFAISYMQVPLYILFHRLTDSYSQLNLNLSPAKRDAT